MRIRDEQQMATCLGYIPLKAEAVQASEQRSLDSACSAPSKGLVDTAYSAHMGEHLVRPLVYYTCTEGTTFVHLQAKTYRISVNLWWHCSVQECYSVNSTIVSR